MPWGAGSAGARPKDSLLVTRANFLDKNDAGGVDIFAEYAWAEVALVTKNGRPLLNVYKKNIDRY
jgi:hypothetical protein